MTGTLNPPTERHLRGEFYTPANVVRLIVENTLGRLCEGMGPDGPRGLKILDPSCGDGAFLTLACDFLLERSPDVGRTRILGDCINGVDIVESALKQARRELPGARLVHGDALLDRGIDWAREFPEAMARGGFDAVIGNPPWTSLAGRFGIGAYSDSEIEHLRRRYGGNSYQPNVFEYFVHRGLELTRPGGYFSFIVPDRMAFNRQYADLRRHLLSHGEILQIIYGVPFPGVTADTMVFVLRRTPTSDGMMLVSEYGRPGSVHAQAEVMRDPDCRFPGPSEPAAWSVIERMESLPGRVLLGEVCGCTSGFGGRADLITETKVSDEQIPILRGRSIGRYVVGRRYWFDFRREKLTGRTMDPAKLGASPKVLIRKTGSSLIAAYDESGDYAEQSLYFLHGNRPDLDLRFVLGILNSRLMNLYYRERCLTNRRTMAHAKKSDLERIPLPPADQVGNDRMVSLVGEMLDRPSPAMDAQIDLLVCEMYRMDPREVPDW